MDLRIARIMQENFWNSYKQTVRPTAQTFHTQVSRPLMSFAHYLRQRYPPTDWNPALTDQPSYPSVPTRLSLPCRESPRRDMWLLWVYLHWRFRTCSTEESHHISHSRRNPYLQLSFLLPYIMRFFKKALRKTKASTTTLLPNTSTPKNWKRYTLKCWMKLV